MKRLAKRVPWFALALLMPAALHAEEGRISGHVSPDVEITIIAKVSGTEAREQKNVKGEVHLPKGGNFVIDNLRPGKYDLLFNSEPEDAYNGDGWFGIEVEPGETTSGINVRLTPRGAKFLIDEVSVGFKGSDRKESRATIVALGCTIKSRPLVLRTLGKTYYLVDIPDETSVEEMIDAFKKQKGVLSAEPNYLMQLIH